MKGKLRHCEYKPREATLVDCEYHPNFFINRSLNVPHFRVDPHRMVVETFTRIDPQPKIAADIVKRPDAKKGSSDPHISDRDSIVFGPSEQKEATELARAEGARLHCVQSETSGLTLATYVVKPRPGYEHLFDQVPNNE